MNPAEKNRLAYLDAMGIQVWTARFQESAVAHPASPGADAAESRLPARLDRLGDGRPGEAPVFPDAAHLSAEAPSAPPFPSRGDGTAPLDSARLSAGAVPEAEGGREPSEAADEPFWDDDDFLEYLAESPIPAQQDPQGDDFCDWETLERRVAACTACPLHQSRTQTVFGVGDRDADWMIIGEAPGEQEDLKGEPFVGPAGLLLNEMLRAIGLSRDKVYIANILKCRPPRNRDPQPQEAEACEHHLRQQLALVKPRIILAVGRIAAQNLLRTATPIGKLRGQAHRYQHIPLVVTYHPAYLLRSPTEKRRAWEDLRLALKTYRQSQ